jgi:hypothetical protein
MAAATRSASSGLRIRLASAIASGWWASRLVKASSSAMLSARVRGAVLRSRRFGISAFRLADSTFGLVVSTFGLAGSTFGWEGSALRLRDSARGFAAATFGWEKSASRDL